MGNATFSGTLYADRIVTKFGDLQGAISSLEASLSSSLASNSPQPDASASALFALGATVNGETQNHIEITKDITLTQSLAVFGDTLLGETTIGGSLMVDGIIRIAGSNIETIGSTLYLQK